MSRFATTALSLFVCSFFIVACARQSISSQAQTSSPSVPPQKVTLTTSATPTPQRLEPKYLFSLGKGEMPIGIEYSPDKKYLFVTESGVERNVVDSNTKLRWLDAQTKQELRSFSHDAMWAKGVVAYSQDNNMVAIDLDGGFDIYQMDNQQKIARVDLDFFEFQTQTTEVKFSPKNHYLLYRTYDSVGHRPGSLQVWNLEKQELAYLIPATDLKKWEEFNSTDQSINIPANPRNPHGYSSNTIIDPNEQFWAVGDADGNIFIWILSTGKLLHLLTGHANRISALALSPDGRMLASSSDDGTVRLWNIASGSLVRVFTGFLAGTSSVSFTADGKQLEVTLSGDHLGQMVDLKTGALTPIVETEAIIPSVGDPYLAALLQDGYIESYGEPYGTSSISPDGTTLVLARTNEFIVRWDIATKTVKDDWFVPDGWVENIAYNAQGQMLALLAQSDAQNFSIWNTQTNQQIFPVKGWQKINNPDDWPRNIWLAPGGSSAIVLAGTHIEFWDILLGRLVNDFDFTASQNLSSHQTAFSQDGSLFYMVLSDDQNTKSFVQVFDVKSGRQLKEISLPKSYGDAALIWPWFASITRDEDKQLSVDLWNLENQTMQNLQLLDDDSYSPHTLCFTPDASLLSLSINDQHQKYFWKTDTAQLLYFNQDSKKDFEFKCSTISPDGKRMVIGNLGKMDFWDIQALTQLAHADSVTPVMLPTPKTTRTPSLTPRPFPTLALTLVPTPVLPAGAIVPENVAQLKATARFGQGNIEQILWPADSSSILTVGSQGIFEYDAKTLVRTGQQQPGTWRNGLMLTADGRRLATRQNGEKVQVWDLTHDKLLAEVVGQQPSISPDGKMLAYVDNKAYTNQAHLLDLDEPKQPMPDLIGYSAVHPIFSPDSQLVAAIAGFSNEVWDAHTGQIVNSLGGPHTPILSISFSDDGKYMIGVAGGTAWVWPLTLGAKPIAITLDPGHDYSGYLLFDVRVTSVALSPNSRMLAVGTSQNHILLYDVRNPGQVLRKLTVQGDPASLLRFSPDGQQLLSADQSGQLILWNAQTGKVIASQTEHVGPLNGMRFGDDDNLLIWSNHTFRAIHPQDATISHAMSIPDGKIFTVSPDALQLVSYSPYHVSLWDVQTGTLTQTLKEEPYDLADWRRSDTRKDFKVATFSNDSKLLFVAGTGAWVYDSGQVLAEPYTGYPYPRRIMFSPDNAHFAACADNCRIGDFKDNSVALSDCATDFGFNPAGDLLVGLKYQCYRDTGGPFHEVAIWQVATGKVLENLPIPEADLTSVAFSTDGRLIAVGQADGKILLIETESLKVLATLSGHNGAVDHLAFSKTGQWLASSAVDGSIRFWNVP